jgi:hypothetical protein
MDASLIAQCATCSARLRIRDPQLAGQIIACPKCGAMVQVGQVAQRIEIRGQHPVNSDALTRDSHAVPASTDAGAVRTKTPPHASMADTMPAAAYPDGLGQRPHEFDGGGADAVSDPPAQQAFGASQGASRQLPMGMPSAWESDQTKRSRQIALIAFLSSGTLVVAAILFWLFVKNWNQSPTTAERNVSNPAETLAEASAANPVSDATQPKGPEGLAAQDPGQEAIQSTPDSTPDSTLGGTTPTELNPIDAANTETPSPESPTKVATDNPASNPTADNTAADNTAADNTAAGASEADAANATSVAGDSPPLDDGGLRLEPSPSTVAAEVGGMQQLPPELQRFLPSDVDLEDLASAEDEVPIDLAPAVLPTAWKAPVDRGNHPLPSKPSKLTSIAQARVAGIQIESQTIGQSVIVLERLFGVPLYLDVRSMDIAGIDVTMPVDLKVTKMTGDALLAKFCELTGLEPFEQPAGAMMLRAPESSQEQIPTTFAVEDLCIDGSPQWLATMFEPIFAIRDAATTDPAASVSIGVSGTSLQYEGPARQRWMLAVALDAIRRGRGIPTQLPSWRIDRWIHREVEAAYPDSIASPPGIHAVAPSRLISDWLGKTRTLTVDWPACTVHGLLPDSVVVPWRGEGEVSFADGVADALSPWDLVLQPLGESVWQVTSSERYGTEMVWVTAPVEGDRAAVEARLAKAIAGSPQQSQIGVVLDENTKTLIGHLPRYLAKELRKICSPSANEDLR